MWLIVGNIGKTDGGHPGKVGGRQSADNVGTQARTSRHNSFNWVKPQAAFEWSAR